MDFPYTSSLYLVTNVSLRSELSLILLKISNRIKMSLVNEAASICGVILEGVAELSAWKADALPLGDARAPLIVPDPKTFDKRPFPLTAARVYIIL